MKLAVMCGAVLFGTVLFAGVVVIPLHYMNPATPQFMKTAGAGIPVLCFGAGFLALVFAKDWRVLKYAAPVGVISPTIVFGISFLFAIPQVVSTMTPIELLTVLVLVMAVIVVLSDVFTGWISGKPWFNRYTDLDSNNPNTLDVVHPPLTSASTTQVELVGAFEITGNPEEYILEDGHAERKSWEPFRNILRAMMAAGAPIGYRLERFRGRTREYYLTLGIGVKSLQQNMDLLQRLLRSNLPKFGFEKHDRFESSPVIAGKGVIGTLSGELLTAEDSRQRADPLTVVAEAFLQLENGVFQTFALPVAPGIARSLKRVLIGKSYRSKMQQAQHTVSTKKSGLLSMGGEESSTIIDMEAATEANKLYRRYQRHRIEHACEAEISVACWSHTKEASERDVKLILEVTKSTIVPADPAKDLRIRIIKRDDIFLRVVSGKPAGHMTLLTPEEIAILFTIPRCDLGIVFTKRESFSTATTPLPEQSLSKSDKEPPLKTQRNLVHSEWINTANNAIILGNPISASGNSIAGRFVWFRPQKFESHFAIYGNIRSGKTTTALSVIAQAIKCGLKVLILVPRRSSDWTILMYLFPDDFWIFKAGGKSSISLGINMFCPPPGVKVASWIRALGDLLSSWMPNDRVMRMHLDDVLHTTYRNCGWDSKTNKSGRPILLSDFWDAVEEVCLNIPYGDEIRQNFYGAIYSRISNLIRNKALVDMYNTEEGITWEQLANHNVLIDTQELTAEDDSSFLMGLIATGIHMYKMTHSTREVTNLLVLEEASYVLKKPNDSDHYGPDSGQFAVGRIVDILTTGGGNGLGVLILEQLAGRLMTDVIKLVVNTISHALADDDERKLVGSHIGASEKQIDHLHQMKKGETVVFIEGEGSPRSVKILQLDKHLDYPLPDHTITDDEISALMKPVFQRHPNLIVKTDLPKDIIDRIERAKPDETTSSPKMNKERMELRESFKGLEYESSELDYKLKQFVQEPMYRSALFDRLERIKNEDSDIEILIDMFFKASRELAGDELNQKWIAERLVIHTEEVYPNNLAPEIISQTINSLRSKIS